MVKQAALKKSETPPRKVVVATAMVSRRIRQVSLKECVAQAERLLKEAREESERRYGRGVDLVVFPENSIQHPGEDPKDTATTLEELKRAMGPKIRAAGAYVIVPSILREEAEGKVRYSNTGVLFDRQGEVVGVYRKAHPVAALGSNVLEGGISAGREFPVFACDFGKVGIQICWDMEYEDGWRALGEKGAEIVCVPSASPQTRRPALYAMLNRYYVVMSTPRDLVAIYNPVGMATARRTELGVLVHQVDLSFAVLPWSASLADGKLLKDKFGERVGFEYYPIEDCGVFWSNDKGMTIGEMVRAAGQSPFDREVSRIKVLQEKDRGGAAK